MTNADIDKALAANLDKDGLLRLTAVDKTVEFFRDKQMTDFKYFNEQYEKIYNFLKNNKNG